MTIDLDKVFEQLNPTHANVRVDGVVHRMRRITLMDVERMKNFSMHSTNDNAAWLASLFDGDTGAPRFLDRIVWLHEEVLADGAVDPQKVPLLRDEMAELEEKAMALLQAIFIVDVELTERSRLAKKAERAAAMIKGQIDADGPLSDTATPERSSST